MKKQRPTEEKATAHVSLNDVFTAVGVVGMQIVEHVQFADHSFVDKTLDELVKKFNTQLQVMACACIEYEELFNIVMVELPPNIVGIKTKNPLYVGDVTEPSYDDDGNVIDLGDDFPF